MNISFFMPAYNCSETIEESVNSIIEGNFSEGDELVIVNDCSTDNTDEILQKIHNKYPFIKIIHNSRNKGGAATRNVAVESCKHPILFCLDSDNVLCPNSIDKLKIFMEQKNADVASFAELFYFRRDVNKIDYKWTFKTGIHTIEDHLSTTLVPAASGNYMFTKESWIKAGQYPEFAGALDTWGFGLRQVMTGAAIYVMPNSFYYHRYSNESYWMRDAESRKASISLRALQLLIPFFDLIDDRDINYIMSSKGRYTWFNNLSKRPIRIATKSKENPIWNVSELQNQYSKNSQDEKIVDITKRAVKYILRLVNVK